MLYTVSRQLHCLFAHGLEHLRGCILAVSRRQCSEDIRRQLNFSQTVL